MNILKPTLAILLLLGPGFARAELHVAAARRLLIRQPPGAS
jgi:hypothetical protein